MRTAAALALLLGGCPIRDPGDLPEATDAGPVSDARLGRLDGATLQADAPPPTIDAACADADADGVCDVVDRCPGFDDARDDDGNGIPDACDDRLIVTLDGAGGDQDSFPTMPPARFAIRYLDGPPCPAMDLAVGDVVAVYAVGSYLVDPSVDDRFAALVACLTDGLDQQLCLVSAPAGVGDSGQCWPESERVGVPDLHAYVVTSLLLVVTALEFAPWYAATAHWEIWGHPGPP